MKDEIATKASFPMKKHQNYQEIEEVGGEQDYDSKKKRKINRRACVNCSKLHKKCDGVDPEPCTRCKSRSIPCVYKERAKRGPKAKQKKTIKNEEMESTQKNVPSYYRTQNTRIQQYPQYYYQGHPPPPPPQMTQQTQQVPSPQPPTQHQTTHQLTPTTHQLTPTTHQLTPTTHQHNPATQKAKYSYPFNMSHYQSGYPPRMYTTHNAKNESPPTQMAMIPTTSTTNNSNSSSSSNSGVSSEEEKKMFMAYGTPKFPTPVMGTTNPSPRISFTSPTMQLTATPPTQLATWRLSATDNMNQSKYMYNAQRTMEPPTGSNSPIQTTQQTPQHTTQPTDLNDFTLQQTMQPRCKNCIKTNEICDIQRPCNRCVAQNCTCIDGLIEQINRPRTKITNIAICVTGSVAAIKIPSLLEALGSTYSIKVIMTKSGAHFINVPQLQHQFPNIEFLGNEDEWRSWKKMGDEVQHIEIRKWAELILFCPLSANTLAKMANGICDNFVTALFRAWDFTDGKRRIILAPAMNTQMWKHPFTMKHIKTIQSLSPTTTHIIYPRSKLLACGDNGIGALAPVDDIIQTIHHLAAPAEATN